MTLEVTIGSEPPGKQPDMSKLAHLRVLLPARALAHLADCLPHNALVRLFCELSAALPVGRGDREASEEAIWSAEGRDFRRGL